MSSKAQPGLSRHNCRLTADAIFHDQLPPLRLNPAAAHHGTSGWLSTDAHPCCGACSSRGLAGAALLAGAAGAAAERINNPIAEFAGIDKITGRIITFDVYIDETVQFGALQVTPRVCYSRPTDGGAED